MIKRVIALAGCAAIAVIAPAGAASATAAAPHAAAPHVRTGPMVAAERSVAAHLKGAVRNDTVTSTNWGGYAVQSASKFTNATGSWVEPSVSCTSTGDQYASFWVGLDGYSSSSVEQLGTDSDCVGRTPSYYAWWEMYPANSVELSTSKYPVRPGDKMTATVSVSGSEFTLTLTDSEGWTFKTTQSGSGLAQSSAEWIAESPEICSSRCTLAKLARFGTMGFTSASAATGGSSEPISAFTYDGGPHEIICETSGGTVRAQPSALGSGGNNFTMTWKHS